MTRLLTSQAHKSLKDSIFHQTKLKIGSTETLKMCCHHSFRELSGLKQQKSHSHFFPPPTHGTARGRVDFPPPLEKPSPSLLMPEFPESHDHHKVSLASFSFSNTQFMIFIFNKFQITLSARLLAILPTAAAPSFVLHGKPSGDDDDDDDTLTKLYHATHIHTHVASYHSESDYGVAVRDMIS